MIARVAVWMALKPGTCRRVGCPSRHWRFRATPQNVAIARHLVASYARWHRAAEPLNVALAVSEAFTNAVVHAYPDAGTSGYVEVVVLRRSDAIEVHVGDDGRGIRPGPRRPDGMGLSMIRQVTERVEITPRLEGGTLLVMSFPVS